MGAWAGGGWGGRDQAAVVANVGAVYVWGYGLGCERVGRKGGRISAVQRPASWAAKSNKRPCHTLHNKPPKETPTHTRTGAPHSTSYPHSHHNSTPQSQAMATTGTTTGRSMTTAALEEGRPLLHPTPQPHSITQLQWVLQMAHSVEPADQQKAAMELNSMIESTTLFPLVSFAPMAHSLSRLLPSQDRTVVYYAARAVKMLLLDDALRDQALLVGLPAVLIAALHTWQEEVPCLREILGALQTLSWDKHSVKSIVAAGTGLGIGRRSSSSSSSSSEAASKGNSSNSTTKLDISSTEEKGIAAATPTTTPSTSSSSSTTSSTSGALLPVLALLQARDQEVMTLALAITANLCAYSDTFLLAHQEFILAVSEALPHVLQAAQNRDRLLRCYGIAALANASANPLLAGRIKELGGVEVVEKIEKENLRANTVTFGGTRVSECCEVALLRLTGSISSSSSRSSKGKVEEEGRALFGRKFTFKFGNSPALELTLDGGKNRASIVGCLLLWVVGVLLVLQPVLRPTNGGGMLGGGGGGIE